MPKKIFTFNDERVKNSYGFYIETAGISLARFNQNPICLNSHWNWTTEVLGTWEDLKIVDGKLQGSPVFNTENNKEVVRQVNEGVIKACSMGILFDEADFVKNENGELVLKKCELMEVSIVAVPSNANSVALYHSNGIQMTEKEIKNLTLSLGAATPPNPENFNQDNNSTMKKIQLSVLAFVALGFAKTTKEVDEAELDEAVLGLKAKIDENELELKKVKADLQAYKDAEKLALEGKITLAVDTAVKEGRITADLAQTYKDLGAQNFDLMTKTLESFPKKVDLKAGVTTPSGTTEPMTEENFQKLSTEAQLAWKEANPEEYKKLFS